MSTPVAPEALLAMAFCVRYTLRKACSRNSPLRPDRSGCAGSSTSASERAGRARSPSQVPALGRSLAALTLSTLLFSACAASLGQQLRRDVGRATVRDIELHVPQILVRHGYTVVQQRRTSVRILYETSWLHREPFEDETERGVEEVRTRFFVEARRGAPNSIPACIKKKAL